MPIAESLSQDTGAAIRDTGLLQLQEPRRRRREWSFPAMRRPQSRRRLALVFSVVLLGGLITALALFSHAMVPAKGVPALEPNPMAVEVVEFYSADQFEQAVSFLGRVEAARESELSFERVGRITCVHVDEGDGVQAMQPLAELDVEKLNAQCDVLTARLQAANAKLDELIAGPRSETIAAQRAEVSRLKSEGKRAVLQRDRQHQLLLQAATSKDEYESALYAAEATRAALDVSIAVLQELENGTRAEQLMTQRAIVKQIEAERASIEVDIRNSQLLAPFAGTVAERFVDEGRVVAPGQSILRLLELSSPEIRVGVDAKTAAGLTVGDCLPVMIHGRNHHAVIKAIRRDIANKTRTVDILLSLVDEHSGSNLLVRSGDLATVHIHRVTRSEGAWIPIGALTEGSRGLWSVFVLTAAASAGDAVQHRIERRDVEVLHTTAERVFVRGPIGDGEPIVASGVHRLVAGQTVRAVNRSGQFISQETH